MTEMKIDREIIKKEFDAGLKDSDIAKKYGWKYNSVKYVRYNELGLIRGYHTIIDKEIIRKAFADGLTDREIAEKNGWKQNTVQQVRYKMGLIHYERNNGASIDLFAELQKHPLKSTADNNYNALYKTLRMKGFPVKRIEISSKCRNSKREKGEGNVGCTIFYIEGQENDVFDMLKDKISTIKLASISRILGLPKSLDIIKYRNIVDDKANMKNLEMTRAELLIAIERKKIDNRRKILEESIAILQRKLKSMDNAKGI